MRQTPRDSDRRQRRDCRQRRQARDSHTVGPQPGTLIAHDDLARYFAIIKGVLSLEYVRGSGTARRRSLQDRVTIVAAAGDMRTMKTSAKTKAISLAVIILGALAGPTLAQGTSDKQIFINPKDIKWGDAPPSMPKGAKLAVLQGDPGKAGPFVVRLMVPPGYKVAPHWHSQDESLTVISGTLYFGKGDKLEMSKAHALSVGGFHALPGKEHHYVFAKTRTVIQVNGSGPFDMTYINPDDDPQKAKE